MAAPKICGYIRVHLARSSDAIALDVYEGEKTSELARRAAGRLLPALSDDEEYGISPVGTGSSMPKENKAPNSGGVYELTVANKKDRPRL